MPVRTLALLVTIAGIAVAFVVSPTSAADSLAGRNGRIVFSADGWVFTVRPDGSGLTVVTIGWGPVWSPHGRRIAYVRTNSVYTIPAGGGRRRLVIENAVSPTWSPLGSWLAVRRASGIWLVKPDGQDPKILTSVVPDYSGLDWSPDGSRIVFARNGMIMTINVRDGTLTTVRVADEPGPGGRCGRDVLKAPTWSPDGSQLAFERLSTCATPGNSPLTFGAIEIDDARTGARLAGVVGDIGSPYDGGALFPSWSPDGHSLAFSTMFRILRALSSCGSPG
jgi:Tol biopolymer transport system component